MQVQDVVLGYNFWYTRKSSPGCYDVVWDVDSLKSALDSKNACEVTAKDGATCAPGWTPELAARATFCDPFNDCVDRVNRAKESIGTDPTVVSTTGSSTNPSYSLNLPKGWDRRDEANDAYIDYAFKPEAYQMRYGSSAAYHLANSILLGFAVVGGVFVVVGLIFEVLGSGSKPVGN
jgi:hypothetical protein